MLTHTTGVPDEILDQDQDPGAVAVQRAVDVAVAAEQGGLDAIWYAEHHFGAQGGFLPDPLPVIAAAAQVTTNIHLGTAAVTLPLAEPLALARTVAVVNALTDGRLQLGLGLGSNPQASAAHGIVHDERHTAFARNLATLTTALAPRAGGPPLVPAPDGLLSRLWVATTSEEGAEAAARAGLGLIAGRRRTPPDGPQAEDRRTADLIRRYRDLSVQPRVALSRPALTMNPHAPALVAVVARHVEESVRSGRLPHGWTTGRWISSGAMALGSPEQVLDRLTEDPCWELADEVVIHQRPLDAFPDTLAIETAAALARLT
ncbi:putative FMN-dependent luciferase-like monooxygenase [Mariniluteicoccus endophyticus]